jgi:hypothetical protein
VRGGRYGLAVTTWELGVRDGLDQALRAYPEMADAYLHNAEFHQNVERIIEVLTAVAACMQGEGVDAFTAERVIQSTWQVMFGSTRRALARQEVR